MKPPLLLFAQAAKIRGYAGVNAYGEKAYSLESSCLNLDPSIIIRTNQARGEVLVKCRFEPAVSNERQKQSADKSFKGILYTLGSWIAPQSTIQVGSGGDKYVVTECIVHYDLTNRPAYLEVLLS